MGPYWGEVGKQLVKNPGYRQVALLVKIMREAPWPGEPKRLWAVQGASTKGGWSMGVIGVDLSASSKRPSAYAVLDERATLCHLDNFATIDELLYAVEVHKPTQIAIDAPLSLPLGMDCLEETHSCSSRLEQKGRTAEQELARMHIGCFFTTKRSIIKGLIYRGMQINQELVQRSYQVIEVYPYATKVILFGDKIPPKNSARGLAFLKERLLNLVGGLEPYIDHLNHDACDAILAAYTASLYNDDRTDSLGTAEEGYIVVPKLLTRAAV